jgi:nucleoside-diphosphate-sugar epimerase
VRENGPSDAVIDMVCFEPLEARSLVRACRDIARQVIFCSTVDVYVRPSERLPMVEDHPRGGVSDYGKKKKECEDILLEAHGKGEICVTVIRPAHTYGEGGTLIHSLGWGTYMLDRMRRGKPIIVHGDGSSLWVSCHIDDAGRAFVGALGNAKAHGKCYHTTGEEWMTWDQYHERIALAMNVELPRLVHIPTDLLWKAVPEHAGAARWNFMFNNLFDNTAARRDLGFAYAVRFVDGARRTVAWLDKEGRIEDASSAPWYDRLIAAWDSAAGSVAGAMGAVGEV